MSMSDHIKQRVLQEFFTNNFFLLLLENGKTGFFCSHGFTSTASYKPSKLGG